MVAIQVNHTCQLDSDTLTGLAIQGDIFARRERLLREIMLVDKCTWDDAHERLIEMDVVNEEFYWFQTLPYRLGFSLAVAGGLASCVLVFSKTCSLPYARGVDLPEGVQDISEMTYNQVGTWTWAWMEPMIGRGRRVSSSCACSSAALSPSRCRWPRTPRRCWGGAPTAWRASSRSTTDGGYRARMGENDARGGHEFHAPLQAPYADRRKQEAELPGPLGLGPGLTRSRRAQDVEWCRRRTRLRSLGSPPAAALWAASGLVSLEPGGAGLSRRLVAAASPACTREHGEAELFPMALGATALVWLQVLTGRIEDRGQHLARPAACPTRPRRHRAE
ncbi:unnamed protein product [Prorocentrum cordatum]|uniref:Uncharacterized protein n=1 Tax=Prorocentrum cordatum TaxID=2364126 RepID=A0ABN9TIV9_9DINO|nr:unnamed protein product [Polarella glacialis]